MQRARVCGTFVQEQTAAQIIKACTDCGDLQTLAELNKEGVDGASMAYNRLLEEGAFADLFDNDVEASDGLSSAGGSKSLASQDQSLMLSSQLGGLDDDLEQDLRESVFTGRKVEMEEFRKLLKHLELGAGGNTSAQLTAKSSSSANSGHMFIHGPPGIGKSTLLDEFVVSCPEDMLVLRSEAREGERRTSYFAFRSIFQQLFHVPRSGSMEKKTKQLISTIENNSFWRTIPHRPLLKAVLAVRLVDTNATQKMVRKAKTESTHKCLTRFLAAASFSKPILVIIDDIQWLDPDSFALLDLLLKYERIAIVTTSREESAALTYESDYISVARKLRLSSFNLFETERFLQLQFAVEDVDQNILKFCYERSNGVPFVIKCIVEVLMEAHLFVRKEERLGLNKARVQDPSQLEKLETPDTVRDLIRSRISKLNKNALFMVFLAATIGTHFRLGVLLDACKRAAASKTGVNSSKSTTSTLKTLVRSELLSVARDGSEGSAFDEKVSLRFNSIATQQVIYDMQSSQSRLGNHLAVANALEDRLMAGMLEGRDSFAIRKKTSRDEGGSAKRARRRGSIAAPGVAKVSNEVELLPKIAFHLEKAEKNLSALEFYFRAGRVASRNGLHGASEFFQKCSELAEKLGDDVSTFMRATYQYKLAKTLIDDANFGKAKEVSAKALALLEADVTASTFNVTLELGNLYLRDSISSCLTGRHVAASEAIEKELQLKLYCIHGHACAAISDSKGALYSAMKAVRVGSVLDIQREDEKSDVIIELAAANGGLCMMMLVLGFRDLAEKANFRSISLTSSITLTGTWRLYLFRAGCLFGLGKWVEAEALFDHCTAEAWEFGIETFQIQLSAMHVHMSMHLLNLDIAEAEMKKMDDLKRKPDLVPSQKAWIAATESIVHLHRGSREDLELSVESGEEYVSLVTSQAVMNEAGVKKWNGSAHCISLIRLGQCELEQMKLQQ